MTSSDDGGYVHDPSSFDADGRRSPEEADADEGSVEGTHPDAVDREFDWRGWTLVGVIVFTFVVSPLAILLWPPNLHYFVALLILPLLPAVLLAVTAVWATTRP
ncbi:hypothetical protein [Salinilacihabitans rarus]|uniref:hypothetical protein n=1 Tax=Salinilacihabitans rarus TaxID=2961596 RepID=UPI0020C86446|nr:hypothetical protein [Salinilacihabitans rarus]